MSRLGVGLVTLIVLLGASPSATAQDAGCAPVSVGDNTGVFFLVLSDRCTRDLANDYGLVADLERDDAPQELLVLVSGSADQETRLVAEVLANEVKLGGVDQHTWHTAAPSAPAPPTADQPTPPPPDNATTPPPPAGDDTMAPPAPEPEPESGN